MPIEKGKIYILEVFYQEYTKVKVLSVKVLGTDRVVVYEDVSDNSTHIAHYSGFNMWINVKKTEELWNEEVSTE